MAATSTVGRQLNEKLLLDFDEVLYVWVQFQKEKPDICPAVALLATCMSAPKDINIGDVIDFLIPDLSHPVLLRELARQIWGKSYHNHKHCIREFADFFTQSKKKALSPESLCTG